VIINKPAGLVVHLWSSRGTLVNALLAHCQTLPGIGECSVLELSIVWIRIRLVWWWLPKQTLQHLQAQLKAKTARREYLGVVYGLPSAESGTINLPIGRHPVDRKKWLSYPSRKADALPLLTGKSKKDWNYTDALPVRNRSHPSNSRPQRPNRSSIVGDPVYSSTRSVGVNLSGQALHAWRESAASGVWTVDWGAPPPTDVYHPASNPPTNCHPP